MGKSESGQIPVLCSKGREARDEYTQGAYEICKTLAQKYEICVAMLEKILCRCLYHRREGMDALGDIT